jgi:hypothetical protein
MVTGSRSCLCCGAAEEDDAHILADCPATGSQDWRLLVADAWSSAATAAAWAAPLPPEDVLVQVYFMLLGALIPLAAATDWVLPSSTAPRFLAALHRALAIATAERLRRREELMAATRVDNTLDHGRDELAVAEPSPLPVERRPTVADLRAVERRRREDSSTGGLPTMGRPMDPGAPAAGEPRRCWLRQRLILLIREDMLVCSHSEGLAAVGFVELFERLTGEPFSDTPGARVGSRVRGMGKVLGNVSREEDIDPPLVSAVRRAFVYWNRRARVPADVAAWR